MVKLGIIQYLTPALQMAWGVLAMHEPMPASRLAGFALAWTVGLVVPGAPGGLGVFEAVLLLRLAVALPQASLLAVALSYRLVVTLADVLTAVLVGVDERLALPGRSSQ